MKKPVYVRCPRCELNYIEKKDKLCSVCKAELSANKDQFVNDLDLELCPICKTNYIQPDEIMCATCLKDHQTEDGEISSDWEEYLNRDEEEIIYDDEETGDMATVADLGTDTLDDDLDSGIGFDDSISDDGLDELGEELGIDLDDEDLDDDFDDEEEEEDFEEDDDDDF
jgi:hypothetical protein